MLIVSLVFADVILPNRESLNELYEANLISVENKKQTDKKKEVQEEKAKEKESEETIVESTSKD